ncbi:MAG: AI-2E family transporter [Candidatus Levyibacteriota bacterium]
METALVVVAIVAAIAAARVAKPFLVPLVLAMLLSYTLRPTVGRLETMGVPRVCAAALVIALLVAAALAGTYAARSSLSGAVAELPVAARKLRHAVSSAAHQPPGPIAHMKDAAAELDKAAAEASGKAPSDPPPPAAGVSGWIRDFVADRSGDVLDAFAAIFLALLLALFLLSAGDTFRRKIVRIAGASLARRRLAVEVLNEIDVQIRACVMTILVSNALIALATAAALLLLGVRDAWTLGMATGVLHLIPYAGALVSAAVAGIATFVDTGSFGHAAIVMSVVAAIAATIGMVLATLLQGRASRMNPVAIFVGVFFFGWLWGGWGLLLGVPILTVLKSVARRVEALAPVHELLSDGQERASRSAGGMRRRAADSQQASPGAARAETIAVVDLRKLEPS